MYYQVDYKLNWTYKMPHSDYCYSECKYFDTELERNKFSVNLFSQNKEGEIVLLWLEESDVRTWQKK